MLPRIIKVILVMAVFMAAAGISTYMTVHLLIRSEDTVMVPQLTAKEVVYALELLSDLGLNTKVKASEFSNEVPRQHVISQDPPAGAELKRGRDVRLIISKGASTVVVPNLSGVLLPQVPVYLEQNGLRQGRVAYTHAQQRSRDEVLAQSPLPGTEAVRGIGVDFLVSAGPAPVLMLMADLTAMGLGQAIQASEDRQLVVKNIAAVYNPGLGNDTVVDQSPAAGYPVTAGDSVELTVNRLRQGIQIKPKRSMELFRYSIEKGFLKTHLRVNINRQGLSMDLFNAFVKPGQQIWLLIPWERPANLFVYADDDLVKTDYYE